MGATSVGTLSREWIIFRPPISRQEKKPIGSDAWHYLFFTRRYTYYVLCYHDETMKPKPFGKWRSLLDYFSFRLNSRHLNRSLWTPGLDCNCYTSEAIKTERISDSRSRERIIVGKESTRKSIIIRELKTKQQKKAKQSYRQKTKERADVNAVGYGWQDGWYFSLLGLPNIRTIVRNGLECEKFPFHPRTWRKGKKTTKKKEEQQKKKKSHAIKRGTQKDRLQVISVGAADEARFLTIERCFSDLAPLPPCSLAQLWNIHDCCLPEPTLKMSFFPPYF